MTIQAWLSIISQVGIQYEKNIPKYAHYWWTVNTYVQNVYAFVCVCVWKTNLCVLVGCAVPRVVPLLLHPQLSLSHAAAHNYWWQRRPGGEEVAAQQHYNAASGFFGRFLLQLFLLLLLVWRDQSLFWKISNLNWIVLSFYMRSKCRDISSMCSFTILLFTTVIIL